MCTNCIVSHEVLILRQNGLNKVGWSIASSCSLHNHKCHLLSVSSLKILFLKWFVLTARRRVATIVLSVSPLMSAYCNHQYDCSLSTIFLVYHHHPLAYHFSNFRHRVSSILGQEFCCSPENAFYIFNQQIYFII